MANQAKNPFFGVKSVHFSLKIGLLGSLRSVSRMLRAPTGSVLGNWRISRLLENL